MKNFKNFIIVILAGILFLEIACKTTEERASGIESYFVPVAFGNLKQNEIKDYAIGTENICKMVKGTEMSEFKPNGVVALGSLELVAEKDNQFVMICYSSFIKNKIRQNSKLSSIYHAASTTKVHCESQLNKRGEILYR